MAGKPGRPRQKELEEVVLKWIRIGRPSLSRQNLARTFYGEAFTKADKAGKKKMIGVGKQLSVECHPTKYGS